MKISSDGRLKVTSVRINQSWAVSILSTHGLSLHNIDSVVYEYTMSISQQRIIFGVKQGTLPYLSHLSLPQLPCLWDQSPELVCAEEHFKELFKSSNCFHHFTNLPFPLEGRPLFFLPGAT